MIHSSVRVYANGDYVFQGVFSEDIVQHIYYNLQYRPGCFFMIDGSVLSKGTYKYEQVEHVRAKYEHLKALSAYPPYK